MIVYTAKLRALMLPHSFAFNWLRHSRLISQVSVLLFTFSLLVLTARQRVYADSFILSCNPNPLVNGAELVSAVGKAATSTADDTIELVAGCTYTLSAVNNPTDGGNGLPLLLDAAVSGKLVIN